MYPNYQNTQKCDKILDRTPTSLFKQICKRCDFLANGADRNN